MPLLIDVHKFVDMCSLLTQNLLRLEAVFFYQKKDVTRVKSWGEGSVLQRERRPILYLPACQWPSRWTPAPATRPQLQTARPASGSTMATASWCRMETRTFPAA